MFVCICRAVTAAEIERAVDSGADCVEAVSAVTGAGTSCGTCHDTIDDVISERCFSCPRLVAEVA